MGKMLIAFWILLSATVGNAQCLGEAQLIAKIQTTQRIGYQGCKAFIDLAQVKFFSSSSVCPLSLAEIANEGIEVGIVNGHDCGKEAGDEIGSVIVRDAQGKLRLD